MYLVVLSLYCLMKKKKLIKIFNDVESTKNQKYEMFLFVMTVVNKQIFPRKMLLSSIEVCQAEIEDWWSQWRANMMARCGSCHTKKSCSLRIYPQRYTFRSDLRWQADKQRKHQNWLSLIENYIFRQVLFVLNTWITKWSIEHLDVSFSTTRFD